MAGYSDTEIEGAVSQFVKNTVTVERDPLGPIKQDVKYNEVLELFSSSLIFDPNAIFYLVYLASNRLNTSVISTIADVDDLLDAIHEMGYRTTDIEKTALLGEAVAALLEVDTVLTQRNALNSSAFSRYLVAVDGFTDASLAPNIRRAGNINRPPQKARESARDLLTSLETAWASYAAVLTTIQGMLAAFNSLDLPTLTIQDSIRKVRSNIQGIQAVFEDMATTRDDKIAESRDAYLDLAAGKSILNNYTSVSDPSAPRMASSSSLVGRAATPLGEGELEVASVMGSISAPWSIEAGVNDELVIAEDGNAPTTYTIVPPAYPSVQSYLSGVYDIHAASAATITGTNTELFTIPAGDGADFQMSITDPALTGLVTFSGSLTSGSRTAAQVAADIGNLSDGSNPLSTYVDVQDVGGAVRLTHKTAGPYLISIGDNPNAPIPSPNVNTVVGLAPADSSVGEVANNLLELDGLSPRIVLTVGTRTRAQIAADINTWATANYPEYTALDDGSFVTIEKHTAGAVSIRISADNVGDRDTILAALAELGFYEGQTDSADAVTAAEVATLLNAAGKLDASVAKTVYESGESGATSGSVLTVPSSEIADGREGTLYIRSGPNAGHYPVLSVLGGVITIDGAFPEVLGYQSWVIVYEVLALSSKSVSLASEIDVQAGSANSTLGLLVVTAAVATTGFRAAESGVDQSFVRVDVVEGDVLRRQVGASTVDHEVIDVSDDKQIELEPALGPEASIQFEILSASAIAHETFQEDVAVWRASRDQSKFSSDLQELNRVMNPLLVNKNPTDAQVGGAEAAAGGLRDLLVDLQATLESFIVAPVGRIDAGLKMLLERGLDRSYNTLLDGDIAAFFSFDKDDASLASYMLKTTRSVVQRDLRVSKLDEDADDIIHDELVVDTDAEFDFSDVDRDEKFNPAGEAPDVSTVDEEILKIRF